MTGPQSRVLSGYSAIGGKPTKPTQQISSEAGLELLNLPSDVLKFTIFNEIQSCRNSRG